MNQLVRLLDIATKIMTPLALSGAVLIVLYAIYRQILSLPVFDNIGSESTFLLLHNISVMLFWLALIALMLGVASYLFTAILKRRMPSLSSEFRLIDASLDRGDSPYVQSTEQGRTYIKRREPMVVEIDSINYDGYSYLFPTIDFKFQNTGSATAFLWQFAIRILEADIDPTPVLKFSISVNDGNLQIEAINKGWGEANNCIIQLDEPIINRIFADEFRYYRGTIESGQLQAIFNLTRNMVNWKQFQHMSTNVENMTAVNRIVVDSLSVKWYCMDVLGKAHECTEKLNLWPERLVLTSEGFFMEFVCTAPARSDVTFISIIDPLQGPHEKSYPISRKIPPGDVERFHIMVGAPMSCHLHMQFVFFTDASKTVESQQFDVHIFNPRDSWWSINYKDGSELQRELESLESHKRGRLDTWDERRLEMLRKQAKEYPFTMSKTH